MSHISNPPTQTTILIVDDHVDNLKLLSDMLDEQGYETRQSLNGLTALKSIELSPPDLILLDIKMPDIDGYTVCDRLKSNLLTKDIPVIFISASHEELDKVKAFSVGGIDYISKPFQCFEVLARIENQLRIKQLQQELKEKNTHLEHLVKKLEEKSRLDPLTQIGNRLHFNDCFEREWKRGMREEEPLGLVLCDLDHFKLYNDTYGHLEGDRCLYTVAQQLKKAVLRGTDLVCRYGGEEFAIILPTTDDSGAEPICQRIVESINQLKIPHSASSVSSHVTLSMGFASFIPAVNLRSDMLIAMSDKALYQAKNTGKNRFVLHHSEFVPCPKP